MAKVKNVRGIQKRLFNLKVKVAVFFHYIPKFIKGKMSLRKYIAFSRRLLFFLSKVQHNKFVQIKKNTRVDLYVPGFPSKAFYTACNKFMVFGEKLPCTTVLISVTSACKFKCKHCYQKYDKGKDININLLVDTVKKLQGMGIAFFNIEGGEPFLVYERLKQVCEAIDDRSEIWINSTGYGITLERLLELKKLNVTAIMFSLHSAEPKALNEFMGDEEAWSTMKKGIDLCHEADIAVAFNTCLQIDDFNNSMFEKVMERAKEFKAVIIQLIKPKPSGGWLESGVEKLEEKGFAQIKSLVNKYNFDEKYKDYPSISAQILEEDKSVFGCTAGGTDRFYINAKGDLQPCEFLNISFGNIERDNFERIYGKMRKCFDEPCEGWLCEKYSGEILKLFKENNLKSLPLPTDISEKLYTNWERGDKTEMYKKLRDIK